MGSVDLTDKKALEKLFADDFSSPVFPVLAELYLKENDLKRAAMVCTIGLENAPHNVNGQYVQALVLIQEKKYRGAKKILTQIVSQNPIHLNSLIQLLAIAHNQKNSITTLYRLAKKILFIDSDYGPALGVIQEYQSSTNIKKKKKKAAHKITIEAPFDINKNIASLTLASILKSQGHYNQALEVLNLLDQKKSEVKEEINNIKKLIKETK